MIENKLWKQMQNKILSQHYFIKLHTNVVIPSCELIILAQYNALNITPMLAKRRGCPKSHKQWRKVLKKRLNHAAAELFAPILHS